MCKVTYNNIVSKTLVDIANKALDVGINQKSRAMIKAEYGDVHEVAAQFVHEQTTAAGSLCES